jgi:hypothetical protein
VEKPERKPSDGVDVWNRNSTQKNTERTVSSHTDSGSPSAANRGLETTKLWTDSLPPCETVDSPPKPVIIVPEDKPKSVSSDTKNGSENKEMPGGYLWCGDWMFSQARGANNDTPYYLFLIFLHFHIFTNVYPFWRPAYSYSVPIKICLSLPTFRSVYCKKLGL